MADHKVVIIDDRHILIVQRTLFSIKTTYITVNAEEKAEFLKLIAPKPLTNKRKSK